jgi:RNA polymerase sigma-70 factor (ECF subfamily)
MMDRSTLSQSEMMATQALQAAPAQGPSGATDFRRVFETELGYVWRSLGRLGIPPRDIEDLAHDVFLQVFRQLERYDAARPIRPWLFGFAFRVASDYRRLARNRLEILDCAAEPRDPSPSALEHLLQGEALTMAQHALECVETERRAVFILHELDGYPIPEVASAFGIPVGTAYSRLRLAREDFSAALGRQQRSRGVR